MELGKERTLQRVTRHERRGREVGAAASRDSAPTTAATNQEPPMALHTLGERLKTERESRALTLEQLSASTKIPASLLDGLERDDLSRWPKGLYRRAFFRAYVDAVGLDAEPLLNEFLRSFPEETPTETLFGDAPTLAPPPVNREPLGTSRAERVGTWVGRSAVASVLEAASVVAVGALVASIASLDVLAGSGAVALIYYPVMRAATGGGRRTSGEARAEATGAAGAGPALPAQHESRQATHPVLVYARAGVARSQSYVRQRAVPVAAAVIRRTGLAARQATISAGRISRRGAQVTSGASIKVIRRACVVLSRAAVIWSRANRQVAGQVIRISSRFFGTANHIFWSGVRATAEQAELLAARQLKRPQQ